MTFYSEKELDELEEIYIIKAKEEARKVENCTHEFKLYVRGYNPGEDTYKCRKCKTHKIIRIC